MTRYPVRPITESEWPGFLAVDQEAFNSTEPPQAGERFKSVIEFDRTLAAFDGELIVGITEVFSFTMTVPGGPIPVGGVTAVGVLPSHRRQGVLTSLMTRQLHDLHESGEAVAALYASESAIYGRFGYGRAADGLFFKVPTRDSAFARHAPVDPSLRIRVATPAAARGDIEKIFEQVMTARPGMYARSEARWTLILADEEFDRARNGRLRCVIAEDDSGPRGYALFRVKPDWTDHEVPDGEVRVNDLFGVDPAAYAAVWRSVLDRDLCSRVTASNRPIDDPLIHLLAEPRHLNPGWFDELWIRVVDVERAMPARRYAAPADVVIEVEDPVCPWNEGRWRLAADTSGASFERSGDAADLTLPVSVLGAGYLGGRRLAALAGAGVIREHSPGTLQRLSTALSWDPQPWAGLIF